mmetsp:Transcript_610/g.1755  ORF Transcript_610/g.1755 Transcript_610/m.1755 type:complete len:208 (+) Transcript_610:284-907(+)
MRSSSVPRSTPNANDSLRFRLSIKDAADTAGPNPVLASPSVRLTRIRITPATAGRIPAAVVKTWSRRKLSASDVRVPRFSCTIASTAASTAACVTPFTNEISVCTVLENCTTATRDDVFATSSVPTTSFTNVLAVRNSDAVSDDEPSTRIATSTGRVHTPGSGWAHGVGADVVVQNCGQCPGHSVPSGWPLASTSSHCGSGLAAKAV